jgi:hypothetical protein
LGEFTSGWRSGIVAASSPQAKGRNHVMRIDCGLRKRRRKRIGRLEGRELLAGGGILLGGKMGGWRLTSED